MASPADLASALRAADGCVVLTGAGVSVGSGVPSFRGSGGLWDRYDPERYATIAAFDHDPAEVWRFLRELDAVVAAARPNAAHHALAELERRGLVAAVVTQNVDGLHQAAGSRTVIELHGSGRTLSCRRCGRRYPRDEAPDLDAPVPACGRCGGVLKPDVTFFGEPLPAGALEAAEAAVRRCGLLLVVGTSAEVYPAAAIPDVARASGARIWELNPEPTLDAHRTLVGAAEDLLPAVVEAVARG